MMFGPVRMAARGKRPIWRRQYCSWAGRKLSSFCVCVLPVRQGEMYTVGKGERWMLFIYSGASFLYIYRLHCGRLEREIGRRRCKQKSTKEEKKTVVIVGGARAAYVALSYESSVAVVKRI